MSMWLGAKLGTQVLRLPGRGTRGTSNGCCLVTKSCWSHCDPMGCGPPGSSVRGTSQARILEQVAIPFSRGPSHPRDWTHVSCLAGAFFTPEPPRKPWNPLWLQVIETQKESLLAQGIFPRVSPQAKSEAQPFSGTADHPACVPRPRISPSLCCCPLWEWSSGTVTPYLLPLPVRPGPQPSMAMWSIRPQSLAPSPSKWHHAQKRGS